MTRTSRAMTHLRLSLSLLLGILGSFYGATTTAAPAAGVFIADKHCELFQSKNKRTNPDLAKSEIGQRYPVVEILGDSHRPEWLRVQSYAAQAPLRWISGECGQYHTSAPAPQEPLSAAAQVSPTLPRTPTSANQCQLDGQFDSNLLALSWQSSFCELYGQRKAECRALSHTPQASQWRQFTLHGLWPNRQQCGTRYGYCGAVKQSPKDFCDYPAIALTSAVRQQLDTVMPSARYGSCLERHEWWKHGICRNQDPNEYFAIAIQLTQALNASAWAQDFIQQHIGKQVTKKELKQEFDKSFGQGAQQKLSLVCAKGLLSEIRLSLPQDLNPAESLAEMLGKAKRAPKDSCPERFTLDQPN